MKLNEKVERRIELHTYFVNSRSKQKILYNVRNIAYITHICKYSQKGLTKLMCLEKRKGLIVSLRLDCNNLPFVSCIIMKPFCPSTLRLCRRLKSLFIHKKHGHHSTLSALLTLFYTKICNTVCFSYLLYIKFIHLYYKHIKLYTVVDSFLFSLKRFKFAFT